MKKTKTKFRLRVLIAVEAMIILTWIGLTIDESVYAVDYSLCGLDSVECPGELPNTLIEVKTPQTGEIEGLKVSVEQIIAVIAYQEDFDNNLLQNIARCESGLVADKRGRLDPRDRGTFQINSRWNPSVSDEQADDPWFATRWTINEIRNGNIWKWDASKHCWNN